MKYKMMISNLQMLLLVVSFSFIIFSFSIYKRKKIWFLTFLIFFIGSLTIGIFSLNIQRLNAIGITFGLNRGADLIVYVSIMLLFYLTLSRYSKSANYEQKQTELIRALSLQNAQGKIEKSETVFVIPAYNENNHCIQVVEEVAKNWYGVVFVDDGSSNGLYKHMQAHFADTPEIVLIQHLTNLGQGAALQTGFTYIQTQSPSTKFIVTFDSDGQHLLSDLPNFQQAFEKNPDLDIVLGSRFLGQAIDIPILKVLTLKIGIIFTFVFSGLRLTDTHNGYRMIKRSALQKLKLKFNGMEHASEILDLIWSQKLKYTEVPNTILYTEYSIARGQKLSNSIKIVKNLMINKFLGK